MEDGGGNGGTLQRLGRLAGPSVRLEDLVAVRVADQSARVGECAAANVARERRLARAEHLRRRDERRLAAANGQELVVCERADDGLELVKAIDEREDFVESGSRARGPCRLGRAAGDGN